ncbi:hypothetical protein RRG08_028982 [Elysia crispata]|uniref:Uncharacterized protein n=1 Tax=Elysia crispata TaxID=231223 RepID=A0AAE1BDP2_9GAST|nr:hypothetical protein RRG08_028982 [Elysia crispata]
MMNWTRYWGHDLCTSAPGNMDVRHQNEAAPQFITTGNEHVWANREAGAGRVSADIDMNGDSIGSGYYLQHEGHCFSCLLSEQLVFISYVSTPSMIFVKVLRFNQLHLTVSHPGLEAATSRLLSPSTIPANRRPRCEVIDNREKHRWATAFFSWTGEGFYKKFALERF